MKKKGFTLIELMLVVIIIGVLAGMVMPRLGKRSEQARVAAAKADITTISLAVDMFEADIGSYPAGITDLMHKGDNPDSWKGPYLKKEPKDPWGRPYNYSSPGTHSADYDIYSSGPNGVEGDNDDTGNW